mgnify:CR=1 FL=1
MTDRSRRDDSADPATETGDDGESDDGESDDAGDDSDSSVLARVKTVADETVGLVVDAVIEAL